MLSGEAAKHLTRRDPSLRYPAEPSACPRLDCWLLPTHRDGHHRDNRLICVRW